ncbi:VOC family protein [Pararhodobacter zhoushanensis]|uniref:VOC family protein n=1 Tax=Pararhodobacter zhoushanensis TaxID=2479545 RepID=UPI000F8EA792|nr:VOC family protein [Pararhodobacter zhoushanensis]
MDLETVDAAAFGRSLSGLGVNLLCRDVRGMAAFLAGVFGLGIHRLSDDFALVRHGEVLIQLHSDATFARHPLHDLLPENPPRGAGAQLYLFGIDPDVAVSRAEAHGGTVVEPPADKPHGLREATILSPEGYAFSPAVPSA